MRLREKLLLSQFPLGLALLIVAAGALYAAGRFGAAPGAILHENFRSFDAGRGMLEALDDIEQRALSPRERSDSGVTAEVAAFERELALQENNITEAGEREATAELKRAWEAYRATLGGEPPAGTVHRDLTRAVREIIDRILEMNRAAMQRKSRDARQEAERLGRALATTAVLAFGLAVLVAGFWLRRMLLPLRALERAVERLSSGDFAARIRVTGNDEVASLSTAFNDMAERLQAYQTSQVGELIAANQRLASVMDSLGEAVIVYDLDALPVTQNDLATRLVGSEPRLELLPEPLQDSVRHAFETVRATGEAYEPSQLDAAVELPGTPQARWLSVSATPVRLSGEVLSGVTVALRDVSRALRLEGFRGDLVAAAAHELRTPLTSLHMAVHLCLEQAAGPLSDRQVDLLAAARQDCERLQSVVDELLETARLESGAARLSRSTLNVVELVQNAVARHRAQAQHAGKALEAVPGDSLATIEADSARLERVLDNLIENALLHAGEDGRVEVGFEAEGDTTRLFVDDSGAGVPEEFRGRVFGKFFRVPGTAKKGSGLGLSIVRDIVRAHGGDVGVETAPLGGARFWFTIPGKRRGSAS